MALLFEEDYTNLRQRGISYEEDEPQRFFLFTSYSLPEDLYTIPVCDVLVVIPPNYNQAGNDMFWTYPRLHRREGKQIPATMNPGGGDSRVWQGKEFCRWSRHWPGHWRPGRDDIISIYRRVYWALSHPDCQ